MKQYVIRFAFAVSVLTLAICMAPFVTEAQTPVLLRTTKISASGVTYLDELVTNAGSIYVRGFESNNVRKLYLLTAPFTSPLLLPGFLLATAPDVLSAPISFKDTLYFVGSKGSDGVSLYLLNAAGQLTEVSELEGVSRAAFSTTTSTPIRMKNSDEYLWISVAVQSNVADNLQLFISDGKKSGTHRVGGVFDSYLPPIVVTSKGAYFSRYGACISPSSDAVPTTAYGYLIHFTADGKTINKINYTDPATGTTCFGKSDSPREWSVGSKYITNNYLGWFELDGEAVKRLSSDPAYLMISPPKEGVRIISEPGQILFGQYNSLFANNKTFDLLTIAPTGVVARQLSLSVQQSINPRSENKSLPLDLISDQTWRMIDGELYLLDRKSGDIFEKDSATSMRRVSTSAGDKSARYQYLTLLLNNQGAVRVGNSVVSVDPTTGLFLSTLGVDQCAGVVVDKITPGICGCTMVDQDSDGDGLLDCKEGCPSDSTKTAPGLCGCGVADTDSDSDGTPDCKDLCPLDLRKSSSVGQCGCGLADTDADLDGVVDCKDGCAGDVTKSAPGVCGCGIADVDSDRDGTLDCLDGCPLDPAKIAPGVKGCGVSESVGGGVTQEGTPNPPTVAATPVVTPTPIVNGVPVDLCLNNSAKTTPGVCGCDELDQDLNLNGIFDCQDPNPRKAPKAPLVTVRGGRRVTVTMDAYLKVRYQITLRKNREIVRLRSGTPVGVIRRLPKGIWKVNYRIWVPGPGKNVFITRTSATARVRVR